MTDHYSDPAKQHPTYPGGLTTSSFSARNTRSPPHSAPRIRRPPLRTEGLALALEELVDESLAPEHS